MPRLRRTPSGIYRNFVPQTLLHDRSFTTGAPYTLQRSWEAFSLILPPPHTSSLIPSPSYLLSPALSSSLSLSPISSSLRLFPPPSSLLSPPSYLVSPPLSPPFSYLLLPRPGTVRIAFRFIQVLLLASYLLLNASPRADSLASCNTEWVSAHGLAEPFRSAALPQFASLSPRETELPAGTRRIPLHLRWHLRLRIKSSLAFTSSNYVFAGISLLGQDCAYSACAWLLFEETRQRLFAARGAAPPPELGAEESRSCARACSCRCSLRCLASRA